MAHERWRAFRASSGSEVPSPGDIAKAILRSVGQEQPPVDLDSVTRLWPELQIHAEDLDGAGYLLDLGATGDVLLRLQDSVTRRRFTLAHELGHWLLGLDDDGRASGQDMTAGAAHANPDIERWCDRFAVELLMPHAFVAPLIANKTIGELPGALLSLPDTLMVSRQSAWLRAAELGNLSVQVWRLDNSGKLTRVRNYAHSASGSHVSRTFTRKVSMLAADLGTGDRRATSGTLPGIELSGQRISSGHELLVVVRSSPSQRA